MVFGSPQNGWLKESPCLWFKVNLLLVATSGAAVGWGPLSTPLSAMGCVQRHFLHFFCVSFYTADKKLI